MNIEQLRDLLRRARLAIDKTKLVKQVNNVASALDRVASNPGDGGAANDYSSGLQVLRAATTKPELNAFSPREIDLMRAMEIAEVAGQELNREIRRIAEDPALLSQNRAEEFKKLANRLNSVVARANKFEEVGAELKFDQVVGESGDTSGFNAELSWYIPRPGVETSLSELKKELLVFEALISSAGELVERPGYRILYLTVLAWLDTARQAARNLQSPVAERAPSVSWLRRIHLPRASRGGGNTAVGIGFSARLSPGRAD